MPTQRTFNATLSRIEPPRLTLRALRIKHGWSQQKMALLVYLASIIDHAPSREAEIRELISFVVNHQIDPPVDPMQLSRFETGRQRPWRNVSRLFCTVFNVVGSGVSEAELFPECGNDIPVAQPSNLDRFMEGCTRDRKLRAIANMGSRDREIATQYLVRGASVEEIAEKLGESQQYVEQRVSGIYAVGERRARIER